MSYLASIYACLLALFGALLIWALPMVAVALTESIRGWAKARRLNRGSAASAPAARTSGLGSVGPRISGASLR
jgi:hypothetical protein